MIKDFVRVANRLDSLGLVKEADALDRIIYKLAAESSPDITEALKRESDLYFQSADPRWVDTSLPMDRLDNEFNRRFNPEKLKPPSSSLPAASNPLQSTTSYLDLESLEDPKDRQDFFFFIKPDR